jgi:hypothetical protein
VQTCYVLFYFISLFLVQSGKQVFPAHFLIPLLIVPFSTTSFFNYYFCPHLLLAKGCSLKDITGKFPVIETIAILLINSNCLFLSEGLYRLSGFFYLAANYSPIILGGRLLLDSSKHCPFLLRRFQYFAGFLVFQNHFNGWPRAGG